MISKRTFCYPLPFLLQRKCDVILDFSVRFSSSSNLVLEGSVPERKEGGMCSWLLCVRYAWCN